MNSYGTYALSELSRVSANISDAVGVLGFTIRLQELCGHPGKGLEIDIWSVRLHFCVVEGLGQNEARVQHPTCDL